MNMLDPHAAARVLWPILREPEAFYWPDRLVATIASPSLTTASHFQIPSSARAARPAGSRSVCRTGVLDPAIAMHVLRREPPLRPSAGAVMLAYALVRPTEAFLRASEPPVPEGYWLVGGADYESYGQILGTHVYRLCGSGSLPTAWNDDALMLAKVGDLEPVKEMTR